VEFAGTVSVESNIVRAAMTPATGKAKAKSERQSDAHLIEGCLKGKESAWSALIDKYKNLIFSIPLHYGFPEDDSADIFQAVCMDLLAELPRLREPSALGGWLIQVTRNKCFHRKQSLSRSKVQEIGDLDPPAPVTEPEGLVSQLEQEQRLRDALTDLHPQCQQLLRMLFFETPPRAYDDVAKELKLARGSVGFVRKNCLEKLREYLERSGY
jgi:RNA polymerase sigma factor (sigma-70 family)